MSAEDTAPRSVGAQITDEMLEAMRSRIGEVRPAHRPWNSEATRDTIRHFAEGIGDQNPLWLDEEYAARGPWGAPIAPPSFFYTCGLTFGGGMPGIHALFAGSDITFNAPIRQGDRITGTIELVDLVEMRGRLSGTMYKQIERMRFRNQDDVVVTENIQSALRFERDEARERRDDKRGRYHNRYEQKYTADAIRGIDEEYAREEIRGSTPRYIEDVTAGDYLPESVKGPLRTTDILAFLMGAGSPYIRAHRVNWAFRQEHPALYIPNSNGVPDIAERVHWEDDFAQAIGTPGVYDYGHERPSWIAQSLTNWIGDTGWLERLRVELRGVNIVGDTTRCGGRISRTSSEGGIHRVHLEVWARNQLGEVSARGDATVQLPSRTN
jgi:acyl dehydratase